MRARRLFSQSGFSLLEVLVVMAIIATMAAIVIPGMTLPTRPPVPPLVEFLETQQRQGIKQGKQVEIYWDANSLVADTGNSFSLGAGLDIIIGRPESGAYLDKKLLAIFYPDSTAIASDFKVVQKMDAGKTVDLYQIAINPFHGEVTYSYPK